MPPSYITSDTNRTTGTRIRNNLLLESDDGLFFRNYFESRPTREQVGRLGAQRSQAGDLPHFATPRTKPCPTLVLARTVSVTDALPPEKSTVNDRSPLPAKGAAGQAAAVKPQGLSLPMPAVPSWQPYDNSAEHSTRSSFSVSDLLPSDPPSPQLYRDEKDLLTGGVSTNTRFSSAPTPLPGERRAQSNEPIAKSPIIGYPPRREATESLYLHKTRSPGRRLERGTNFAEKAPSSSSDLLTSSFTHLTFSQDREPSWSLPTHDITPHASRSRSLGRQSLTPSEIASSRVGSDNGTRVFSSGDEDELDQISESAYDSLRTGMTKNSGSFTLPALETLFDCPTETQLCNDQEEGDSATVEMRDEIFVVTPSTTGTGSALMDEVESVSTPRQKNPRLARDIADELTIGPVPSFGKETSQACIQNNGNAEPSDGVEDWDEELLASSAQEDVFAARPTSVPTMTNTQISSQPLCRTSMDRPDNKPSLFDWAEQPSADQSFDDFSPQRPKTAYGNKDLDIRGSRSSGRVTQSSIHARSQSVPLAPDSKKRSAVASKFGTWGVGGKGVTEDWDEDFDFGHPDPDDEEILQEQQRLDEGISMFVPLQIQEQQSNVLANISLLREWGLLIEELKEIKTKAVALGIAQEQGKAIFEEIDAMVDLADQEAADTGPLAGMSRASSPSGFDDEFEDALSHVSTENKHDVAPTVAGDDHEDVLAPLDALGITLRRSLETTSSNGRRPRKNSEAVARSVIEAIQQRRSPSDPVLAADRSSSPQKKVPFDTATLKHIVPYVRNLLHKVKQVMREAEALQESPRRSREKSDPPFSKAFLRPDDDPFVL